ncbi:MAG: hypothetical protein LC808_26230 [Actinobacteria bacterium]|nr:hypothetical protein [Actinomycetota bacterium]
MADPRSDVEELNAALTRLGEQAAADPAYRDQLRKNQVEELQAAGVSALALSGAFVEEGAEEEEVVAYGLAMGGTGGRIIISDRCVGTCSSITLKVCVEPAAARPPGQTGPAARFGPAGAAGSG